MTEPQLSKLMAKVLSGEASTSEKKEIDKWVNNSEENETLYKASQKAWQETKTTLHVDNSEEVFNSIMNRIESSEQVEDRKKVIALSARSNTRRLFYFAAAIAFIISSIFVFYDQFSSDSASIAEQKWVQKANGKGQKLKILLSDGTSVWLNGESSLSYAKPFGAENRQVILSGEAYFDVAHDPNKPFTVKTGNVSTTALGTTFNIKAFETEDFINVDLESGKVLVSIDEIENKQQVFVDPGERISYNRNNRQMLKSEFDHEHDLGWKDGILSFRDASFEEVINRLSRWYGVEFVIQNEGTNTRNWDYTGKFSNDYLSGILSGMSFTKNFEYSINNDIVTINFK